MHTIEDLVRIYVKMRDVKSAKTAEFDAWKKEHTEKMDKVESAMLAMLNENDAESIKTESGTVYRKTTLKPSIRDFDALGAYILETGQLELLQRRVSSDAVRTLTKPDELGNVFEIPGVEVIYEAEIGVRRA